MNEIINPEDILILIDGKRMKDFIPKNKESDFKSLYSIKGIIIEAYNIKEALAKYKEIKSNPLED